MPLFHGTSDALINTIANNGFDPTKNINAAVGYGSYMFLADVLIGKCVNTRQFVQKEEPVSLSSHFINTLPKLHTRGHHQDHSGLLRCVCS